MLFEIAMKNLFALLILSLPFVAFAAHADAGCIFDVAAKNLSGDMVSQVTIGTVVVTMDADHPTVEITVPAGPLHVTASQIDGYTVEVSSQDYICRGVLPDGSQEWAGLVVTYSKE
jgi:hypothetical protein